MTASLAALGKGEQGEVAVVANSTRRPSNKRKQEGDVKASRVLRMLRTSTDRLSVIALRRREGLSDGRARGMRIVTGRNFRCRCWYVERDIKSQRYFARGVYIVLEI